MREKKTILRCDICECDTPKLYRIKLPMPFYSLGDYFPVHSRTGMIATGEFEICPQCAMKIINMIEPSCRKYGEYDYAGCVVEWKGEES